MKNIKDTLSNICAALIAICGSIVAIGQTIVLPEVLMTVSGSIVVVCTVIIGYLTGKTPGAQTKSPEQVEIQNNENKE